MVENQNQQVVVDWIKTLDLGNGDPFAVLAEDVTFVIPGPKSNPIFGTFKGKEEVGKFFTESGNKVERQNLKVKSCLAEGNKIVVFLDEEIVPKKEPKKTHTNHTAWSFTLNNDKKIVYLYCYDDTAVTSEAFG